MDQPAKKPRFKWLSVLLLIASVVGILASIQDYNEIEDGTAEWNSTRAAPWYYQNPDGFLVYIIIEVIILIAAGSYAIANLVTKKEKYWEIGWSLIILVQLSWLVNKFIKG